MVVAGHHTIETIGRLDLRLLDRQIIMLRLIQAEADELSCLTKHQFEDLDGLMGFLGELYSSLVQDSR